MTLPGAPYAPADGEVAPPPVASAPPSPVVDLALRVTGAVVAVVAAVVTALAEVGLASLRVGGTLVGLSIPLAAAGNVALAWFAYRAVGAKWAIALPWLVWTAVMFVAAGIRTTEGDYLLPAGNWVALPMILVGSIAFGVYTYRLILTAPPR